MRLRSRCRRMTSPHPDLAIWSAAVNAALLGTSRAPLRVEAADGSLGAACTAVAGDEPDPSATLLRVAAAATVYRRCGRMAALSDEPPPAVCPPDTRPMCPPAAAALLRRIMNGEHASLIGEWLTLAARHGVRAPADALRDLLDLARREPKLRPLVLSVGGARADWLAARTRSGRSRPQVESRRARGNVRDRDRSRATRGAAATSGARCGTRPHDAGGVMGAGRAGRSRRVRGGTRDRAEPRRRAVSRACARRSAQGGTAGRGVAPRAASGIGARRTNDRTGT
jgi:hypothetical protein